MTCVPRLFSSKLVVLLLTIGAPFFSCQSFAQTSAPADSITVAIAPAYAQVSGVYRLFFGESYRQLWAAPVKIKVLHLAQAKGGLTIVEPGGGLQTQSLHLQDASGRQWVLRSLQKYAERGLPRAFRGTIVQHIKQDQVSTSHPYAALTVPPLLEALQVPHAHPEIVYLADDPALGEYRVAYAKQVYWLEEGADSADNTEKAQLRLKQDHDTQVDQSTVLRARLLDMLLGDYDRHEGQWRWQRTAQGQTSRYLPVPRDRDHVYFMPTGVFPWVLSRPLFRTLLRGYDDQLRAINRWNDKAHDFDHYFLNQLSEDDWKKQITYVQTQLSDSLINQAIKLLPGPIYRLSGPELTRKLTARRALLPRQGLKYYRFLSKKVEIRGSSKPEKVEIVHQAQGQLQVTISKLQADGGTGPVIYQRTFDPVVTREVVLYGFSKPDVVLTTGNAHSRIRVRLVKDDAKEAPADGADSR